MLCAWLAHLSAPFVEVSLRVLLRADGGAGIGLGHLNRCLSLATALRRLGANPFFAVHGDNNAVRLAGDAGFPARPLGDPGSSAEAEAIATGFDCTVIVVDSYLTDGTYLATLREAGYLVIALDDLNAHEFDCDMVVSQGPHAPSAGYRSSTGDTKFLLGPSYTILRQEFWESPLPVVKERVGNILITSGGADPNGCLPSWISLVDSIDASFSITAIVGPFFTNRDAVHEAGSSTEHVTRIVDSPAVIRPMIASADVALIAGGQTTFEVTALGIPAVAVEIASNQHPQLQGFAAENAMLVAGKADDEATAASIVSMVGLLVRNVEERRRLSSAGKNLVNRKGALVVAEEILRAASVG
ncbi:MAG: UDP-2,4-diacetamido-2,4,6-trideoxy-beta-L-altropyranose hydrolase [Actinomycetota bacterium]